MDYEPQLQDVPLTPGQVAALRLVVGRNLDAVVEALRGLKPDGVVCAIGLDIGQEERLDAPLLSIALERDREQIRSEIGSDEDWERLWAPGQAFAEEEEVELPFLSEAPDFAEAEAALLEGLEGRVLDPPRWVFNRVARVLTATPMPFATTDDFVAFVFDVSFDSDLIREQLEFVAPPETFRRLVSRQMIGATESDVLAAMEDELRSANEQANEEPA